MNHTLPQTIDEVRKLIPQAPPFMLVDRIIAYDPQEIVSGFEIPADHVLVDENGHLSEAGLIENFAQTIALHQGYEYALRSLPAPVGYIGSIKNFEIQTLVPAGEKLNTKVEILQQMMGVTMVKGEVRWGDQVVAYGEMRTVIVE